MPQLTTGEYFYVGGTVGLTAMSVAQLAESHGPLTLTQFLLAVYDSPWLTVVALNALCAVLASVARLVVALTFGALSDDESKVWQ